MNYYPFHVGDYLTHTAHLSPLEDIAYRRLLDLYYINEGPLPADISACARRIRMKEQEAEVEQVLGEFFELTDAGWASQRCDQEIAAMQDKQEKARASAAASVSARRAKVQPMINDDSASVERPLSDRSATVELPTPTPTPTPISKSKDLDKTKPGKRAVVSKPDFVSDSVWNDFLAIRKAKKAPLTTTALEGIAREAAKAGVSLQDALEVCCSRGWQGFNADWVGQGTNAPPRPSKFDPSEFLRNQGRNHGSVIDMPVERVA